MRQNYKIFLLVAEELSYSKAAKKAYVTQQCVSNHIQRLEKELNTKLFSKNPTIQLTEAGKILYNAVRIWKSFQIMPLKVLEKFLMVQKEVFLWE